MTIARYTPAVDAHMFEKWFLDEFPKYAGLRDEVIDQSGTEVIDQARVSLAGFRLPFTYHPSMLI